MIQDFVDEVNNNIDDSIRNMHTIIPGKIVKYFPETNLANVEPVMKLRKPDGSMIPYPLVTGVPVVFPQSYNQNATIASTIHPNDGCLLLIAEQSIDYWMYGQETDTDLAFDITNGICIPGMFVPPNKVMQEACSDDAIILNLKGTQIKITDGEIIVDAEHVQLNGKMDATGDITAEQVSVAHHIHTGDSGGLTSQPHKTGTTKSSSAPKRLSAKSPVSDIDNDNDSDVQNENISGFRTYIIQFGKEDWFYEDAVYKCRRDLTDITPSLSDNAYLLKTERYANGSYTNVICGYAFDSDSITLIYSSPITARAVIHDPGQEAIII